MKKLLLGTTALVGASFMATAAMAAPEIKVGGFLDFQVGITSQDIDNFGPSPSGIGSVTNERGYGFLNDSELILRASDKLDNGLAWAVKIELEANSDEVPRNGGSSDETTLTLSGTWGRMFFGNDDGPVDTMKIGGKTAVRDAGTGGIGGNFRRWTGWNTANGDLSSNDMDVTDSGDAIKIAYITPRVAGFQAGVSFTPNDSDTSQDRVTDGASSDTQENYWEFGVGYDQKFGDVQVRLAGVYSRADAQNQAASEDVRAWGLGAAVGFAGFTISAGYFNNNDSELAPGVANDKLDGWGVGLGYNMGAWDFGLSYLLSKAGAGTRGAGLTGDDELRVASAGVTYDLGSGLTVYTEATWFETERAVSTTATSNSGVTLVSGIAVEF